MAVEHHTELVDAVLNRDINRASALMSEHIGYTLDVYLHSENEAQ